MKIRIAATLLVIAGHQAHADCNQEKNPSKSLTTGGAFFYFKTVKINPEDKTSPPEKQLVLLSKDCTSGEEKKVDSMPFLADTGEIEEIFTTSSPRKIFVIHKVEIASDTGVPYSSAYYTVLVYTPNGLNSTRDRDLTEYFSFGADILNENSTKNIYIFPYKTEFSIKKELNSNSFRMLSKKEELRAAISRKTYIYNEPVTTEKRKSYLIGGDKIAVIKKQANWCNIKYETAKKKTINGWVFCSNLSIPEQ